MRKNFGESPESGFTLVEVAVAIALLGLGLMTLTALSVRLMDDTREEINRTKASFFAQYILETTLADRFSQNSSASTSGGNSGSLLQKLKELKYLEGLGNQADFNYLQSWNYQLTVESITLPLSTSAFEKYLLRIYWGEGANQEFILETIKKAKDLGQTR